MPIFLPKFDLKFSNLSMLLRLLSCALLALGTGATNPAPAPDPTPVPRQALTLKQLPEALRPESGGRLLEAWRWTDQRGENTLVAWRKLTMTRFEDRDTHTEAQRMVQLYVCQYVRQYGRYEELWRLQDGVYACDFEAHIGLIPGATTVTDLDGNGQTETTLMYDFSCRGKKVSPGDLKLVVFDGPAKYTLRGFSVVQADGRPASERPPAPPAEPCCLDQLSADQREQAYQRNEHMGRYRNETEFRLQPQLLAFARQHWQQFCAPPTSKSR